MDPRVTYITWMLRKCRTLDFVCHPVIVDWFHSKQLFCRHRTFISVHFYSGQVLAGDVADIDELEQAERYLPTTCFNSISQS